MSIYKTYSYNLKTHQSRFSLFLTTLKMEAAHSSATLVTIYSSTWLHYQDYLTVHQNCCEKVISCKTNTYKQNHSNQKVVISKQYKQNTKVMMTMFQIIIVQAKILNFTWLVRNLSLGPDFVYYNKYSTAVFC